jgi:hypothetical protein
MRNRPDYIVKVQRRISDLREDSKLPEMGTQELRDAWVKKLNSLFNMAATLAANGSQEKEGVKEQFLSSRERQLWAHAAAHIGLVMGNLSKEYDEIKFNEDLAKLERVVDAIKKFQSGSAGSEYDANHPVPGATGEGSSPGTFNSQ